MESAIMAARKHTTKRQRSSRRRKKICNACGAENALNASACKTCGKEKFAPAWVVAKRTVNRQVAVEITNSNPQFGESKQRITLSKWWPGGNASFHIPNASQWERIAEIIDNELAPLLKWKSSRTLVNAAQDASKSARTRKKSLQQLVVDHPDFLKQLVAAIDPKKLAASDFEALTETFAGISDAYTNANAGFREAFVSVVKKLPRQKQRALEDLDLLLKGWSLQVITNVAQQVRGRLETINLFEAQVQDERTFEIIGDNSVHRILERAMWLIDERYWLLFSNATLRKQIGDEMSARDKKRYGKKRPDFVCGTYGNRLIIRPCRLTPQELRLAELGELVEDRAA